MVEWEVQADLNSSSFWYSGTPSLSPGQTRDTLHHDRPVSSFRPITVAIELTLARELPILHTGGRYTALTHLEPGQVIMDRY
jgi:hypothetical protein